MSTTQDTALPVDTLKDAAPFLRRPFTAQAVKFKVQATWPKDAPKTGLIVAYIDARAVIERLNAVIPHKWNDPEYNDLGSGVLECVLTVDGITRRDVGSGYQGTLGWGYASAPLLDGKQLICVPGGKQGLLAALDPATGKVLKQGRVKALEAVKGPLSALYEALNADQRKKADRILTPMGCMM